MKENDLIERAFPLNERPALSILHGCMVHLHERQREIAYNFADQFDLDAIGEYTFINLALYSLHNIAHKILRERSFSQFI
jgi:hypothetical protein